MKTILLLPIVLFFSFFISCVQVNPQHASLKSKTKGIIYITKTTVGFNIYSNHGELILEYTKLNCDSLSLQTLDDIYETALEFNNKELFKEKIDTTQIKVISYVTK